MAITCQVVTKPMRNVLRARNAHVIGLLRAYYVPHVTRYVSPPRNSHVIAHVIDLVYGPTHYGAPREARPAPRDVGNAEGIERAALELCSHLGTSPACGGVQYARLRMCVSA